MAINFPDSPSVNDTHTVGDRTWKWDGTVWNIVVGTTSDHGNLAGLSDDDHTQYLRADGTRTAASLTVSGAVTVDTDTFVVDNVNDRVGIGTTSPSTTLHVNGSILANDSVTIGDGGEYVAGSIYSDANWGMIFRAKQASPAQADFRWANSADTERMRIDSSGNVGISTTTPAYELDVNGRVRLGGAGDDIYIGVSGTASELFHYGGIINLEGTGNYPNSLNWHSNNDTSFWHMSGPRELENDIFRVYHYNGTTYTGAITFKPNGYVGIGGTNNPAYGLDVYGAEDVASRINISSGNTAYRYLMRFSRNGGLLSNGIYADTGTAYFGTPSDVNLKTGIETISTSDALTALNALRAVDYRYLLDTDDVVRKGFIAQEVEEVIPEAVKRVGGGHPTTQLVFDENGDLQAESVDENGDPLIQEEPDIILNWEPITTTVVAAVQELSSLVSSLTARIEALENS